MNGLMPDVLTPFMGAGAAVLAATGRDARRNQALVQALRHSDVFREYQRAFETTMGLPLALHPPGKFGLVHAGSRQANPFCTLMAGGSRSCSACLEVQQRLRDQSMQQGDTVTCFAGLSETAVPVHLGEKVIAFLHIGQVLLHPPSGSEFARTAHHLRRCGAEVDLPAARLAYFRTRVIERRSYEAVIRLLTIFARQLSVLSNQLVMAAEQASPPVIQKAKIYIREHADEELTLSRVASAVNTSPFYFCKLFRRATGLNFLDFVARTRVENVKSALLNANVRISEAAYGAGFQSLSQFNRVFKRVVGEQPRAWREHLGRNGLVPPA